MAENRIIDLKKIGSKDLPIPLVCFVQFKSMNGKEKFLKAMQINPIKRAIYKCICRFRIIQHKYLNAEKWPKIKPSSEPTLILWENLGTHAIENFIRKFFVSIFSLILILFGFYGITTFENYMDTDQQDFDIQTCLNIDQIEKAEALLDLKNTNSTQFTFGCYCF